MNERIEAIVYGKVQGVFFRQTTKEEALKLAIVGEVKNRNDGTVFVVAEGTRPCLEALVDFLRVGPEHARVDRVEVSWQQPLGIHQTFIVVGYQHGSSDSV